MMVMVVLNGHHYLISGWDNLTLAEKVVVVRQLRRHAGGDVTQILFSTYNHPSLLGERRGHIVKIYNAGSWRSPWMLSCVLSHELGNEHIGKERRTHSFEEIVRNKCR